MRIRWPSLHFRAGAHSCLQGNLSQIVTVWRNRLEREDECFVGKGDQLTGPEIRRFLNEMAAVLGTKRSCGMERLKSAAQSHGDHRATLQGYTLPMVLKEFSILRRTLLDVIESAQSIRTSERKVIYEAIEAGMIEASAHFIARAQIQEQRAMEDCQRSSDRLRRASISGRTALWEWSEGSDNIWRSDNHHSLYGYRDPPESWTLEDFMARVHADDRESIQEVVRQSRNGQKHYSVEYRVTWPDGTIHWLQGQGEARFDNSGKLISVGGTVTDISERKEAEQALSHTIQQELLSRQETEKAMGQLQTEKDLRERFVATLTHDLRNPLTVAKTSLQLLRQHPGEKAAHEKLLRLAESGIDRIQRMVGDLLDANRISSGQPIPLQFQACDLVEIAQNIIEELTLVYGERFVLECPASAPGSWSRDGLRRVIENLLVNAVKYGAPDQPIQVRVGLDGRFAWLSVHNAGKELSEEEQARLFRPFSRTRSAQESGKQGWGLGLTLVKGLVEAHGGSARVVSGPGSGTEFTIHIPRLPLARAKAA